MSTARFPCFHCDACGEQLPLEVWCVANLQALVCLGCCPCPVHYADDPGGIAVFSGTPLRWRGWPAP